MPVPPHVHRNRGLVVAALLLLAPALAGAQSTFQSAGTLNHVRVFHTATALADGRILVVGGADGVTFGSVPSEIFDPATGVSTLTGAMSENRSLHAAVRLADGRVAVFGGRDAEAPNPARLSVEVYNPATNAWSTVATLSQAHEPAFAAMLPGGQILVGGGTTTATELFNPATNAVSAGGTMIEAREVAVSMATLNDGRVLVVGGDATGPEVYDPVSNTWSATGPPVVNRAGVGMARLPDGRVLVAGGLPPAGGTPLNAAEIFDPASNTWSPTGNLLEARYFPWLDVMGDGRIIISGGLDETIAAALDSTEFFEPATGTWTAGPQMPAFRLAHVGVVASDGSLYLIGGSTDLQVDRLARDQVPTANAGADLIANGCLACANGVTVSAAGSSDDGPLSYTWSLGATVLAQAVDPVDTATLTLPIGTHTVTLTVRDGIGQENTDTVMVTIVAVDDAYLAQIGVLEAALAACEASGGGGGGGGGGGSDIDALMNAFEAHLRARFRNPAFELPGAAGIDELARLLDELTDADHDVQMKVYRALGGGKPRGKKDDDRKDHDKKKK